MRLTTVTTAIAVFAVMTTAGSAAELSRAYQACVNRNTTNSAWGACGGDEIDRQERHLNQVWSSKLGCFDKRSEAWQRLLDEQRTWLKWKDGACRFYGANDRDGSRMFGREGQVLDGPACRAEIVAQRAEFLEQLCRGR